MESSLAALAGSLFAAFSRTDMRSPARISVLIWPAPPDIFSIIDLILAAVRAIAFIASRWNSGLRVFALALWLRRESECVKFLRSCIMNEQARLKGADSFLSRRASPG